MAPRGPSAREPQPHPFWAIFKEGIALHSHAFRGPLQVPQPHSAEGAAARSSFPHAVVNALCASNNVHKSGELHNRVQGAPCRSA